MDIYITEQYLPVGRESELLEQTECPKCGHSVDVYFTSLGKGANNSGYKILQCKQCGERSDIDTNLALLAILWKKKTPDNRRK